MTVALIAVAFIITPYSYAAFMAWLKFKERQLAAQQRKDQEASK